MTYQQAKNFIPPKRIIVERLHGKKLLVNQTLKDAAAQQ
jgi:hypothetical protein